jgi:hypothetical protein
MKTFNSTILFLFVDALAERTDVEIQSENRNTQPFTVILKST